MKVAELMLLVSDAVKAAVWARSEVPPEATESFRGIVHGKWVISVVAWKDSEGNERCDGIATSGTSAIRLLPKQAETALRLARAARPIN